MIPRLHIPRASYREVETSGPSRHGHSALRAKYDLAVLRTVAPFGTSRIRFRLLGDLVEMMGIWLNTTSDYTHENGEAVAVLLGR